MVNLIIPFLFPHKQIIIPLKYLFIKSYETFINKIIYMDF